MDELLGHTRLEREGSHGPHRSRAAANAVRDDDKLILQNWVLTQLPATMMLEFQASFSTRQHT